MDEMDVGGVSSDHSDDDITFLTPNLNNVITITSIVL